MPSPHPVHPDTLRAWAVAIRPASLPLAAGPVLVGAAMAWLRTGQVSPGLMALAMMGALLMQIITNLQNDVGFTQRGGERGGQRIGLPRATALGWLQPASVRRAIIGLSLLATGLGLVLVMQRGWPVLAMGSASLLAALAYMGGPRPIAYTPWGELTVFVFFGGVAVLGTDWLLTGGTGLTSALAASAIGCLSAAALAVNNHRDQAHDAQLGRHTFVVLWGEQASRRLLWLLLTWPFVACLGMAWASATGWLLLPWLAAPTAWRVWRDFVRCAPGLGYNGILFRVFRLELNYACALTAGAVLAPLGA